MPAFRCLLYVCVSIALCDIVAAKRVASWPINWGDPIPSNLTALNSSAGVKLLTSSAYNTAHWRLEDSFTTQYNQAACALASLVTVLNAIDRIPAPVDPIFAPHAYFTQGYFFNGSKSSCTRSVITPDYMNHHGTTMLQMAALAACYGAHQEVHFAEKSSLENFRKEMLDVMKTKGVFVVINFKRPVLAQEGYAHFSPISAYNKKADSFLLLDVARYKYPPVWVPADTLFAAMNTTTSDNSSRGWVVIS